MLSLALLHQFAWLAVAFAQDFTDIVKLSVGCSTAVVVAYALAYWPRRA